jgi:hypothetical protein
MIKRIAETYRKVAMCGASRTSLRSKPRSSARDTHPPASILDLAGDASVERRSSSKRGGTPMQSHHHEQPLQTSPAASLNRVAFSATVHCLTGCAIGEVLGMVIGTAVGLSTGATIALAVVLAFLFGYGLTMLPLLRSALAFGSALDPAFASDRHRSRSWRSSTTSSCGSSLEPWTPG